MEAARWAPSARNEQPWRYIVSANENNEKHIPEEFEMAIGYRDTYEILPESLVKKAFVPRHRKSLSEIAFIDDLNTS